MSWRGGWHLASGFQILALLCSCCVISCPSYPSLRLRFLCLEHLSPSSVRHWLHFILSLRLSLLRPTFPERPMKTRGLPCHSPLQQPWLTAFLEAFSTWYLCSLFVPCFVGCECVHSHAATHSDHCSPVPASAHPGWVIDKCVPTLNECTDSGVMTKLAAPCHWEDEVHLTPERAY